MGTQPPLQKGGRAPNLRPTFIVAKRLDGSRCYLARWHEGRPQPRRLCVRWGPSPPSIKEAEPRGGAPQFLAYVYCGQTAGWIKMALSMEVGLGPVHIVLDGNTAPLPKREQSPLEFSAHLYCGQTDGCIKMPLGNWYGGRTQPRRLCVGWGTSFLPEKGWSPTLPPNFRPTSIMAKRLSGSRCHLVRR